MINTVAPLVPVLLAYGLSLGLTYLIREAARALGLVARPRPDRWHTRPTALFGGVAIFLSVLVPAVFSLPWTPAAAAVLGGSSFVWGVGLVDDVVRLRPYQKLVGQLIGATPVLMTGLLLNWTPWPAVNVGLTLLWLVGITNALNLLDNMDGLAAGVAAAASAFFCLASVRAGEPAGVVLSAVMTASLAGYLVYNWSPASIFMGDCGALFIGSFLAGLGLLVGGQGRALGPGEVAAPVLILAVPVFDTTFVTVVRKWHGRPASQGGRDHTSHRLVALGLSEQTAVRVLSAVSAATGGVGLMLGGVGVAAAWSLCGIVLIGLTGFGSVLARVDVYGAGATPVSPVPPQGE